MYIYVYIYMHSAYVGRERTGAAAAVEKQRHAPPRARTVRLIRGHRVVKRLVRSQIQNNCSAEMWSGSEEGSY